jgi:WD40 repeat protein
VANDVVALVHSRFEHLKQISFLHKVRVTKSGDIDYDCIDAKCTPHTKQISMIETLKSSHSAPRFLTGSADRSLVLWNMGVSYDSVSAHILHMEHSSRVNGIYYSDHRQSVFTAGQDCRLIEWSLSVSKLKEKEKQDYPVN